MDRQPTAMVRYILDGRPECIAEARRALRAFLDRADPPFDPCTVDHAELATSELISNAVQHAPGPCALQLTDDGRHLRIEVDDSSVEAPVERDVDLSQGEGGAGLRLLRALAGHVEAHIHQPVGKTVSVVFTRGCR
jgi:anti-sigma regulatory factor (Ser/Thr protein kinase)